MAKLNHKLFPSAFSTFGIDQEFGFQFFVFQFQRIDLLIKLGATYALFIGHTFFVLRDDLLVGEDGDFRVILEV